MKYTPPIAALASLVVLCAWPAALHADDAWDRQGWEGEEHLGLVLEWTAESNEGLIDGDLRHGFSVGVGARVVLWAQSGSSLSGEISTAALGNHFGLDVAAYGLYLDETFMWMGGVDLASRNVLGLNTAESRLRISTLTDLLWPEVGLAVVDDQSGLMLGWHFHADFLLTPKLFVSTRLGGQIVYLGDAPTPLATFSVGLGAR